MVVLGFAVVIGVPFVLGCACMALPVPRVVKVAIAVLPLALFTFAGWGGVFWIGDIGGAVTIAIATWSWLLGVALSRDVRSIRHLALHTARR